MKYLPDDYFVFLLYAVSIFVGLVVATFPTVYTSMGGSDGNKNMLRAAFVLHWIATLFGLYIVYFMFMKKSPILFPFIIVALFLHLASHMAIIRIFNPMKFLEGNFSDSLRWDNP
jgi:hypothetical protein